MSRNLERHHVPANTDLAPDQWWTDSMIAADIRARVRALHRDGQTQLQIATRTGVSSRGVHRILHRVSDDTAPTRTGRYEVRAPRCGWPTQDGEPCRQPTTDGTACRYHWDAWCQAQPSPAEKRRRAKRRARPIVRS